ncbi:MAG: hypothetical protein AAFN13_06365, partial [Bacteroidota bacterium]
MQPFEVDPSVVIGPTTESVGDAVAIDVYLDATTSMEGYVGSQTEYAEFLRALEASLIATWGSSDVRFFRFGTRVDSIGRADYLAARDDKAFYRRRGIFERTNIDSVLVRTAPDRLSLVVTDLFQDAGDTNALVAEIKDRVFARDLAMGILAIGSTFDGRIYDAPGGAYSYTSTPGDAATHRPFYALTFGGPAQVARLFETLEGTEGVRQDRMAMISPYVVDDYELTLAKQPGDASRGINIASADGGAYRFVVREDYDGGLLDATLALTPTPGAAQPNPERVALTAYRRASGEADSTLTSDFAISDVSADGDDLTFTLTVDVDGPAGRYAYLVLLETGEVNGLLPPAW